MTYFALEDRGCRMLREDYDLTREDIQLLSNRDALTAFFAKLGYDTNARLVQNAAAMGFSSDNLRPAITHIERLASQDTGALYQHRPLDIRTQTGGSATTRLDSEPSQAG